jgi:hypothetical protein
MFSTLRVGGLIRWMTQVDFSPLALLHALLILERVCVENAWSWTEILGQGHWRRAGFVGGWTSSPFRVEFICVEEGPASALGEPNSSGEEVIIHGWIAMCGEIFRTCGPLWFRWSMRLVTTVEKSLDVLLLQCIPLRLCLLLCSDRIVKLSKELLVVLFQIQRDTLTLRFLSGGGRGETALTLSLWGSRW